MNKNFVQITHIIDNYRDIFEKLFSDTRKKFNLIKQIPFDEEQAIRDQDNYEKYVLKIFDEIKQKDENLYLFIITMLYHDQCIMLNTTDDSFRSDNLELLKELKNNVNSEEDLVKLIEQDYTYLMDMIVYFLDFCDLNYYEKRKRIYLSSDLNKYLQKIYKFNIIDILFYTKKINLYDLIKMYNEFNLLRIFKNDVDPIDYCIKNIQNLFYSDIENSYELIVSLLNESYKYFLYDYEIKRINDNDSFNLNSLIQNKDLEMISYEILNNYKYLELVLKYFYEDKFNYDSNYKNKVNNFYNLKRNEKIKKKLMVNDSGSN